MVIIGVDYHPSFQQIAFLDQDTGECGEQGLNHSDGEAERQSRRASLVTQRLHRINPRGAQRRYIACSQRHGSKNRGDA